MARSSIPIDYHKVLDYINIGRGKDEEQPLYTEDDIKEGTPEEESLCWAITETGELFPNAGYYKDKKQWVYAYVSHGLAYEANIPGKVIAYIMYKDGKI